LSGEFIKVVVLLTTFLTLPLHPREVVMKWMERNEGGGLRGKRERGSE
jgi:hypothetical protein